MGYHCEPNPFPEDDILDCGDMSEPDSMDDLDEHVLVHLINTEQTGLKGHFLFCSQSIYSHCTYEGIEDVG